MTLKIIDTTLRDGEQTPGVLFSCKEKVEIATLLDKAGVHCIEVGTPANGPAEQAAIKEILNRNLNAEIVTWNRAIKEDIDCSLAIDSKFVHISLPVSEIMIREKLRRTGDWVLKQLEIASNYLAGEDVCFSVGAEDATRADSNFLREYTLLAKELGACRVRLCDTIGISDPFAIQGLVVPLKDLGIDLEIHAHNDLGMATANALAAAKSGVKGIDTTVIGIGERAGNTPLEEIIMALHLNLKTETGIRLDMMKELARTVSVASCRPISLGKCVVGEGIFSHESGIHVDGIRKNPETYEPYLPELVGASRKIVIGKHSGPKAIVSKLKELNCYSGPKRAGLAVRKIRKLAARQKGGVSDKQILGIVQKAVNMTSSQFPAF